MNLRSRGILKLDGHEGAEGAELWRNEDGVGGVEYVRPINKTKNPQFKNSTWWRSDIHLSIIALLAVRVSRHSQTLREKFYPTFSSNKNHQPTIRTAEGVCRPFWYAESSYGLHLFIASLIVEGWLEEGLPVKSRLSQWARWVCVVWGPGVWWT